MDLVLFLKGVAVGLAIAAPVGPVAILCVKRTLFQGGRVGFAAGLGAVTADVFFGALASFGVAIVSAFLFRHEAALRAIGGVFMLVLGAMNWFKKSAADDDSARGSRVLRAYASGFVLTITNPVTVFAFTGIFAAFSVVNQDMRAIDSATLLIGVTIGCVIWWFGLTMLATLLRRRVSNRDFRWMNRLAGGVLILFGTAALASLLLPWTFPVTAR